VQEYLGCISVAPPRHGHDIAYRHLLGRGIFQGRDDRLAFSRPENLVGIAHDAPAAGMAIELCGKLGRLDVAALDVNFHHPRMPLHDDDGIGRTIKPERPAQFIECVVRSAGKPL